MMRLPKHDTVILKAVREGIHPCHEANTSLYVYELLRHCLDWPIDLIAPQKSTRGFIDYYLTFRNPQACLRIEVKRFDGELKDEHIRKYLVRRGPKRQDLDVGVLTNLKEWRIYVAGRTVKTASGAPMNEVEGITIKGPADLHRLRQLIGFRSNGGLRHLRAALGETESVLKHLLCHDRTVLRAIRDELFQIKTHHALEVRVPQYQQLRRLVTTFIQGTPLTDCPFSLSKLKQALRSHTVAQVANDTLVDHFGARNRVGTVRKTLQAIVNGHERI